MFFYVQMKWNYQGRISQDELWALEEKEAVHGIEGIKSGFVQLFKVVSQHRIIAIVQTESLEDLDRNSMGWLPMREYLEFEVVWALRDYEGFADDVKARFPQPGAAVTQLPPASSPDTRSVAETWFDSMRTGDFDRATALLDDDVLWENISSTKGVSDLAPWLGTYHGKQAVLDSFKVWAAKSEMLSFTLFSLLVDGDQAMGMVHEHARCLSNGNTYDLYVATQLTIRGGKILKWRVYWDPSPLIAAYKNIP